MQALPGRISSAAARGVTDQAYTVAFASAVSFVIDRLEGGPQLVEDSGGLTKFGISARAFPGVDVAQLTREAAVGLYHVSYWLPLRCDALPAGLDLLVFDCGVNQGVAQAARLLQRVLRIPEDGLIGPHTIGAASAFLPPAELRALYSSIRIGAYYELVARRPGLTPYLYGWRCRVMRIADQAGARGGR